MLADERYPTDLVVTKKYFLQSGWKDAISGRDRWNHTIRCSALFDAERKALDDGQLSRGKVLSILRNACYAHTAGNTPPIAAVEAAG